MQEVDRQWRTATPRRHLSDERLTMVCYARPAIRMAAVLLVVFLVFGRSMGHVLDSAALFAAIAIAVGGAALAAAVAFTVFLSVRQRRAATGGCVSCQLRCQHAMTEQPRRLPLVSMVDRGAAAGARRPALPVVAAGPAVSAGRVVSAGRPGPAGPRWPDRPAIHSGVPLRPAASRPAVAARPPVSRPVVWRPVAVPYVPAPREAGRERAGSAVLPALRLGFVAAGPHRGVGWLQRAVHHIEQVGPDRVRIHGVLELGGEARDGRLGVVAGPVEPDRKSVV